jgi:hypothetical protein
MLLPEYGFGEVVRRWSVNLHADRSVLIRADFHAEKSLGPDIAVWDAAIRELCDQDRVGMDVDKLFHGLSVTQEAACAFC